MDSLSPDEHQSHKNNELGMYEAQLISTHNHYLHDQINNLVPILAGLFQQTRQKHATLLDQVKDFINISTGLTPFGHGEDFRIGSGKLDKKQTRGRLQVTITRQQEC